MMVLLPLSEIVARRLFGRGIPGSGPIVQHLTLWVGFLGAAIAAREGKLLALATGTFIPPGVARRAADILAAAYGACASVVLGFGGWRIAMIEREAGTQIGAGIYAWVAQLVLPISFALIALRLVWRVGGAEHSSTSSVRLQPDVGPPKGGHYEYLIRSPWVDRALAATG